LKCPGAFRHTMVTYSHRNSNATRSWADGDKCYA